MAPVSQPVAVLNPILPKVNAAEGRGLEPHGRITIVVMVPRARHLNRPVVPCLS